jgi:hypothetical protein
MARSAPFMLGTSTVAAQPGQGLREGQHLAGVGQLGSSLGGTKEPTSISRWPASTPARIHSSLAAVGTTVATLCRPSRRPISRTTTRRGRDSVKEEACMGSQFRISVLAFHLNFGTMKFQSEFLARPST